MQMEFNNTRYSKYNNYFKKIQIVKFDHNKKFYDRWKLLKHQGGLTNDLPTSSWHFILLH